MEGFSDGSSTLPASTTSEQASASTIKITTPKGVVIFMDALRN